MSNKFEVPEKYKHIKMMLLIILAIVATLGGLTQGGEMLAPKDKTPEVEIPTVETPVEPAPKEPALDKKLSYKGKEVILTRHAKCRMGCREIDQSEVAEILGQNSINYRKSNTKDQPCPTFSLEGKSHDNQTCRVVIADCADIVKVITVIDLKNEYVCHCD